MKVVSLLLGLLLTSGAVGAGQTDSSESYRDTRALLLVMERAHEYDALKKLFEESVVRRADLIKGLYDPEQKVSLNAQTILKYTADPAGLAALEEWFSYRRKQGQEYWMSPVDSINEVRYLQGRKNALPSLILRNEFKGRKDGWGKLIAFESKSKCALVEIVFGQTFTEGWHVAVREENGKWRLLSKSRVWQS
jgi:hypothetical protein